MLNLQSIRPDRGGDKHGDDVRHVAESPLACLDALSLAPEKPCAIGGEAPMEQHALLIACPLL